MYTYHIGFPGGKKVDVSIGPFLIKTDQTLENGGEETAPEPFDLFLASLGACAGIYAKSFCDSRKLNTNGMQLTQDVEFNDKTGMIEKIHLKLQVPEDFPEKYLGAIAKSMKGCAVKKHLRPDLPVNIDIITEPS